MHIEYKVGALLAVTLKLTNTITTQELSKFADRRKHRMDKPADVTVSIAYFPVRDCGGRYCCGGS